MAKYASIMTDDYEHCYVCGDRACDWHHIFHGPDKKLSEDLGCMVPLCRHCHALVHHVGGEFDRKLKEDAQREYLRRKFGRCYL
jgi:hypothetical protein